MTISKESLFFFTFFNKAVDYNWFEYQTNNNLLSIHYSNQFLLANEHNRSKTVFSRSRTQPRVVHSSESTENIILLQVVMGIMISYRAEKFTHCVGMCLSHRNDTFAIKFLYGCKNRIKFNITTGLQTNQKINITVWHLIRQCTRISRIVRYTYKKQYAVCLC